MFRIECFVDDKNLAKALLALQGLALQQPVIQPVINAEANGKGVQSITSGSLCEVFYDYCRKSKATEITPKEIKAWLTKIGRKASTATYAIKCGVETGFLKRLGKGNKVRYTILKVAKSKKGT